MVFVDKSLEEMTEEIGGVDKEIEHNIVTTFNTTGDYEITYLETLGEQVPNEKDLQHLTSYGTGRVLLLMIENCHIRGYDSTIGFPIKIKYYFGPKGVIKQVIDQGKGFDVQKILQGIKEASKDAPDYIKELGLIGRSALFAIHWHKIFSKEGELKKGDHFQDFGIGMFSLSHPEYQAHIVSSTESPTGTTVTVMYKNQHLEE